MTDRTEHKAISCTMCKGSGQFLIDWKFSGLDKSSFNYNADFYACEKCGLIWNSSVTEDILERFYRDECMYFDNDHFDITAPSNVEKFKYYQYILDRYNTNCDIADIGCGRGGFLFWLRKNGWRKNCYGVDVDVKSLPELATHDVTFIEGGATALPFPDGSQQILTYFHVFEHILDTDLVLREAYRVLKSDGYIFIEVPDAGKYREQPISTGFWPSIREHVYHFSTRSLVTVLNARGFFVRLVRRTTLPTPEFSYPSLIIVAQKCGGRNSIEDYGKGDVGRFIVESYEKMRARAAELQELARKRAKLVFWGVSNQLLSVLPLLTDLVQNIKICDVNQLKQKASVRGIPVISPGGCFAENSSLIVSSCLHAEAIESAAIKLGWQKRDIDNLFESVWNINKTGD